MLMIVQEIFGQCKFSVRGSNNNIRRCIIGSAFRLMIKFKASGDLKPLYMQEPPNPTEPAL
jgi:hypothetical protein